MEAATPGGVHQAAHDVSRPATDLDAQGEKLRTKFDALAAPVLGKAAAAALADRLTNLPAAPNTRDLLTLTRVVASHQPGVGMLEGG